MQSYCHLVLIHGSGAGKESRFLLMLGAFTAYRKSTPVDTRSSVYVKERAQRFDDPILLRHMDDVVGTGPDEHPMRDFEHL